MRSTYVLILIGIYCHWRCVGFQLSWIEFRMLFLKRDICGFLACTRFWCRCRVIFWDFDLFSAIFGRNIFVCLLLRLCRNCFCGVATKSIYLCIILLRLSLNCSCTCGFRHKNHPCGFAAKETQNKDVQSYNSLCMRLWCTKNYLFGSAATKKSLNCFLFFYLLQNWFPMKIRRKETKNCWVISEKIPGFFNAIIYGFNDEIRVKYRRIFGCLRPGQASSMGSRNSTNTLRDAINYQSASEESVSDVSDVER